MKCYSACVLLIAIINSVSSENFSKLTETVIENSDKVYFKPRNVPIVENLARNAKYNSQLWNAPRSPTEGQINDRTIRYGNVKYVKPSGKTEILYAGTYFPVNEVLKKLSEDKFDPFDRSSGDTFKTKDIPLMSDDYLQYKRSLDEKSIPTAERRSISYFGEDEDDDEEDADYEAEETDEDVAAIKAKGKRDRKKELKKYAKHAQYMLPLLLAYKLKFFTLIPLLKGMLVLLTGSTGMAGFFFALFAAVIGLKTGNW